MRKLRVAVVCSIPFGRGGGVIRHIVETARALSDRVEHHVFSTRPVAPSPAWVEAHALAPRGSQTFAFFVFNSRLNDVDWDAFDVIHCHIADGFGIKTSRPKLLSVHGLVADEMEHRPTEGFSDWLHGLPLNLYIPLERRNIFSADHIHVHSDYVRRQVIDRMGACGLPKITVIPPGLDARRFPLTPAPRTSPPRVLAVGRLNSRKGFDVLVRAWQRVRGPAELRIVGEGAERRRLEELARGARNPVSFLGPVDDAAVRAEYAGALLTVVPSRQEGFGFASVESQCSGRAVIISNGGSLPETVDPAAARWTFPSEDVDALANLIDEALADEEGTRRRGEQARTFVLSEFDMRRYADRFYGMYSELAGGGGPASRGTGGSAS